MPRRWGHKVPCKPKFVMEIFKTQTVIYEKVANMIIKNWAMNVKRGTFMTKLDVKKHGKGLVDHIVKTGLNRTI
jgi:hypothetical protein